LIEIIVSKLFLKALWKKKQMIHAEFYPFFNLLSFS